MFIATKLNSMNLHTFLSSADFFLKLTFSKNYFRNTIRVTNSFDSHQDQGFVGPDLHPNRLQRLSADDTDRQRVKFIKGKMILFNCNVFYEI